MGTLSAQVPPPTWMDTSQTSEGALGDMSKPCGPEKKTSTWAGGAGPRG